MELCNAFDKDLFFLKKIRNITIDDEMWFVAKDICDVLETKDVTTALKKLPDKNKKSAVINCSHGKQDMRIVNESGLYRLIMRSKKPVAEKFQNVICGHVLPSIRKGKFNLQDFLNSVEDSFTKNYNNSNDIEKGFETMFKNMDIKFKFIE